MCFVVTLTGKRSVENKWLHDVNKDNHNRHYKQVIQEMLTLQDGKPWKRDSTDKDGDNENEISCILSSAVRARKPVS